MLAFQKVDFRRNAAILIDAMTSNGDLSDNASTIKEPQSYRIAVIDLGSNTARMVVINASSNWLPCTATARRSGSCWMPLRCYTTWGGSSATAAITGIRRH